MVIIRDERKEALKNRERRRKKFAGTKEGFRTTTGISRGTSPSIATQTVTASVPIPQPQAGTQTPAQERVITRNVGEQRTEVLRTDRFGYETTRTTVGRPRQVIIDHTIEGVSQFTETERKELRRRARIDKKETNNPLHLTVLQNPLGLGENKDFFVSGVTFEREKLESERLAKQVRGKASKKEVFVSRAIETGYRGGEIIERGTIAALEFGKETFNFSGSSRASPFRQQKVKTAVKQAQEVVIPPISEVRSNPFLIVPSAAALAFQTGVIGTLTHAPPKQKVIKVTPAHKGKITIASKGDEARFFAQQKFKVTVKQPPPDVGFRVPKSLGGTGGDSTIVARYTGTSVSRGAAVGTGKASTITSESFVTLRDSSRKIVFKDTLTGQSKGFSTDTAFGQRVKAFNIKTGKLASTSFEAGGKVSVIQDKNLLIVQQGTTLGGKGVSLSGSKITATQSGIKFPHSITAQPTHNPIYKGHIISSSVTKVPVGGLGKSGQLIGGGQRLIHDTVTPLSRLVAPPRLDLSSLSTSTSVSAGSSVRLGLSSLSAFGQTTSTTQRLQSSTLIGESILARPTTKTLTLPYTKTLIEQKITPVQITTPRTTPGIETRIITRTTPGVTIPNVPFTPVTRIPPPPPPGILFGGGGGLTSSSGALTNLTGGKFGFVPSLIGQTLGIGATGGTIFSGLGVRQRKKKGRKK